MSGSKTITTEDRLANVHPGQILRLDFLRDMDLSAAEVAKSLGIEATRLQAVLDEKSPVDADLDLRLTRYFGMSEGFFLGLQIDYDLEEAKLQAGHDLDRIIPRAA